MERCNVTESQIQRTYKKTVFYVCLISAGLDKYQLPLMNPRDALHHGKRATNKGGRSV